MFQRIVKSRIRQGFASISHGDIEPVVRQFAPVVQFSFAGNTAISGDFHQRETVRAWFERVHRLFPDLLLEAKDIMVSGTPLNTLAVTQFTVRATLPDHSIYRNQGYQILNLRRGRIVKDLLIEDTELLHSALQCLQQFGVEEAAAPPLHDMAATA